MMLARVGLSALLEEFRLRTTFPTVDSQIIAGSRKSFVFGGRQIEQYPRNYLQKDLIGHLKFAARYEPIDLRAWKAVLSSFDEKQLFEWIAGDLTSKYARRVWYLYEMLTGTRLDLPDAPRTGYVDLLDPALHIVGEGRNVRRQWITDNLLGVAGYCPLIRRTETMKQWIHKGLDYQVRDLMSTYPPDLLVRAAQYSYSKETRSSFAIEGEQISPLRAERYVALLQKAPEFDLGNAEEFVRLQNAIVDLRYAAKGWRTDQNYVGETLSDYRQRVHYVCPKPEDVPELMLGWMEMTKRLRVSALDSVSAAAAASFGFVFIHPFNDGNGRIHRFLVHQVLASRKFTPDGLLFPVSAVMLRQRAEYDAVLEAFSAPLRTLIDYSLSDDGRMQVDSDTIDLYRYWDATPQVEYLYGCIEQTIQHDLVDEIRFLAKFDTAMAATLEVVDMPTRRASLLVKLILQNGGSLAAGKRSHFAELTDDELREIEEAVNVPAQA